MALTKAEKAILTQLLPVPSSAEPVHHWPTNMPVLTSFHFRHGDFANLPITNAVQDALLQSSHNNNHTPGVNVRLVADLAAESKKAIRCGTPRCAVGNVLSAFGRDCRFDAWDDSPLEEQVAVGDGPVAKFVQQYAKELGGKANSLWELSSIFEYGPDSDEGFYDPPSAEEAAQAWSRTLKHFNYTEEKL